MPRGLLVLSLAVLIGSSTACGSGNGGDSASSVHTGMHHVLGDPCDAPSDGKVVTWSAGSDDLAAATFAPTITSGAPTDTAVVVANQSGSTLCNWMPALAELRAYGTVWLHDTFDDGMAVKNVEETVKEALAAGDTRVLLVGASVGAKASLVAAAGMGHELVGVVALSPEATLDDGTVVLSKIEKTAFPTFLATTKRDPYQAYQACQAFQKARPGVTTLVTLPGAAHGTDLVKPPLSTTVLPAIRTFVTKLAAG